MSRYHQRRPHRPQNLPWGTTFKTMVLHGQIVRVAVLPSDDSARPTGRPTSRYHKADLEPAPIAKSKDEDRADEILATARPKRNSSRAKHERAKKRRRKRKRTQIT